MNETPRLRSAFPSTPQSKKKPERQSASASGSWTSPSIQKAVNTLVADSNDPLIPVRLLDAPSQRLYIAFFYLGLTVWRLYDYFRVLSDEADSLWLFMKWVLIDSVVLYGLPGLRIPWLQWSSSTMTLLFVSHAMLNAILMLRIPIPLQAWLVAFTRLLYDRELAVLERSVKPASVLQNASLILGKQIIHILPEGSAVLNPDQSSFCIGSFQEFVTLPIRINQTTPIVIEMLRIDFETNSNETITLTGRELGKLRKQADREFGKPDPTSALTLKVPIKRSGLYRLSRVVDQSNLEVRRRASDALVVKCPSASIEPVALHKCKGDLTNFQIRVEGTPPLKIRYSKTVNSKDTGHHVLEHISPEDLPSPLTGQRTSGAPITFDSSSEVDVSWARMQHVQVPINESLGLSGYYRYSLDEVHDACGNVIDFTGSQLDVPRRRKSPEGKVLEQVLRVHERPRAAFHGYNAQPEVKVQSGKSFELPIDITSTGPRSLSDSLHKISYAFERTFADQDHAAELTDHDISMKPTDPLPEVRVPGLYSLKSIETEFCSGDILEPSTCLLTNPPEPSLAINYEVIPGKCAGKPVGLTIGLELTGTPPFRVSYTVSHDGGKVTPEMKVIPQVHEQIEFRPSVAGRYVYTFTHVSDAVYSTPRFFSGANHLKVEQEIKPPALARFADSSISRKACIEETASSYVNFIGHGRLELEYELIHNGRRRKAQKNMIVGNGGAGVTIETEPLRDGGEYTLALLSIKEENGCKNPLSQELKLDVGLQRPRVSFGLIESKRTIMALEQKKIELPVRLQGSPPFEVSYHNREQSIKPTLVVLHDQNDRIEVNKAGVYEILGMRDSACSGTIDESSNRFEVRWIPRPAIHVPQGATIQLEDGKYVKKDVCEGDEDTTEITFTGTAPFHVLYEQRLRPDHGSQSISSRSIKAGLNSAVLKMDTSNAGLNEYELVKLSDHSYDHDPYGFTTVKMSQRVLSNPSARFTNTGKTYKYCKDDESSDEVIPIALTGVPPFHLEMEIKHHAITKPEVVNVPHIESKQYSFHIPHRLLALGTHSLTIRKVTDSRGCQRNMDFNAPHVQVSVADAPTISPLEEYVEYCVGDRISYTLSGVPPFNVFYTFQGQDRKAAVPTTSFRRLAEKPGEFTITGISDHRSTDACRARVTISKLIHEMPSVRVSKGRTATAEIHEGSDTEILFEFGGTPPFEFIYIRSTHVPKGKKSEIIETKSEISYEHAKTIRASDEGIYEVVSIKDRYCSFSIQKAQGKSSQKALIY
ncbi:MAG: hypothetical protein Q9195_000417 [Heterodermia aff. obscurata]